MNQQPDILADVEAFLANHSISPTAFGKEALGDPSFVPNIRKGRRLWPETEAKVRAYMAQRSKAETH